MRKIKTNKIGQVTIFIILAIVIVAVLVIIFYPRIQTTFFSAKTPQNYIEDCISRDFSDTLEAIENQGGSLNPENYYIYNDNHVEYLCYTNEYYKTCIMHQPMLKQHIESELKSAIGKKAVERTRAVVEDYQSRGYDVQSKNPEVSVELFPSNIRISINAGIVITKDTTESYDSVVINKKSELYDLVMIALSILNSEADMGDSSPEIYMYYYPDLRVEKFKQGDGSKIYIISNRINEEKFVFASRSLSWGSGYNVDEGFAK